MEIGGHYPGKSANPRHTTTSMNTPTPPSDLQHGLRQATKHLHRLLDHHPLLQPLLRKDINERAYGDALAALHGVHAQCETLAGAYLAHQPDQFELAPRQHWLLADLQALGRAPWQPGRRLQLPPIDSSAQLVGLLYTLEGSGLGGQHICQHLRQTGLTLPMRFFDGFGVLAAQRWADFWQFAHRHCAPNQQIQALSSAQALFHEVRKHLDMCCEEYQ